MRGFRCANCNKPFFLITDDPKMIRADKECIRWYIKNGYKFEKFGNDDIDAEDLWCNCMEDDVYGKETQIPDHC